MLGLDPRAARVTWTVFLVVLVREPSWRSSRAAAAGAGALVAAVMAALSCAIKRERGMCGETPQPRLCVFQTHTSENVYIFTHALHALLLEEHRLAEDHLQPDLQPAALARRPHACQHPARLHVEAVAVRDACCMYVCLCGVRRQSRASAHNPKPKPTTTYTSIHTHPHM